MPLASPFLENKYTKVYLTLIERAKLRGWNRKSAPCDVEDHHIIPKCKSFGGSNDQENRVFLTLREHFICHLLLTKMVNGRQKYSMMHALHRLMHGRNKEARSLSSRMYELSKQLWLNTPYPDDIREKQRLQKIKWFQDNTVSEETRAKCALPTKGKTYEEIYGSKEEADRQRLKRGLARRNKPQKKGRQYAWNKGLTKETDERVKNTYLKRKKQ